MVYIACVMKKVLTISSVRLPADWLSEPLYADELGLRTPLNHRPRRHKKEHPTSAWQANPQDGQD